MIEINPRESPMIPTALVRDMKGAFWGGIKMTKDNVMFGLPLIAMEAGMAQPGEAIPTLTGRLAGLTMQPALSGAISAGLVAMVGFPPAAAAIVSTILAVYISTKIENPLIRGLYWATKHGSEAQHVAFGGNVDDTLTSQKRRQRAMREMSGALTPARQWLGQEALILHR
jgi:hypothetical protein